MYILPVVIWLYCCCSLWCLNNLEVQKSPRGDRSHSVWHKDAGGVRSLVVLNVYYKTYVVLFQEVNIVLCKNDTGYEGKGYTNFFRTDINPLNV